MTQIRTFALFLFILILSLQVASQDGTTVAPVVQPHPRFLYKISGGNEVTREQFKFMASIHEKGSHICGATILTPRTILTAAHCFDGGSLKALHLLWVTVGTNDLLAGNGIRHAICRVGLHPNYNETTHVNDVAIVQLHVKMLSRHPYIKPIKLANEPVAVNTDVIALGWGRTDDLGAKTTKLMSVTLQTVDIQICKQRYRREFNEMNVCVQSNEGKGKGVCKGDSGGPIIVGDYQVGIASMGAQCGLALPFIFTSVFQYRDFILKAAKSIEDRPFE